MSERDSAKGTGGRRSRATSGGGWRASKFLTADQRDRLLQHLKRGGIEGAQAQRFVLSCDFHAHRVKHGHWSAKPLDQQQFFRNVCAAAESLQEQLGRLPRQAAESLDAETEGSGEHFEDVFDDLGELLARLVKLAGRAADRVPVSPSRRVDVEAGEGLIDGLVLAYRQQFEALPPGGQRGWFVEMTTELGEDLELACGFGVVARVLKRYGAS